jgi:hypothetical protein
VAIEESVMTEDSLLIAAVATVWLVLALLYAFVPMLDMPGGALIWGAGAAVFLALTSAILVAERSSGPKR